MVVWEVGGFQKLMTSGLDVLNEVVFSDSISGMGTFDQEEDLS